MPGWVGMLTNGPSKLVLAKAAASGRAPKVGIRSYISSQEGSTKREIAPVESQLTSVALHQIGLFCGRRRPRVGENPAERTGRSGTLHSGVWRTRRLVARSRRRSSDH